MVTLDQESKELLRSFTNKTIEDSYLSRQKTMGQDVTSEPEGEANLRLVELESALAELKAMKKKIAPILFDLKDGTLKRVAPSRYQEEESLAEEPKLRNAIKQISSSFGDSM